MEPGGGVVGVALGRVGWVVLGALEGLGAENDLEPRLPKERPRPNRASASDANSQPPNTMKVKIIRKPFSHGFLSIL